MTAERTACYGKAGTASRHRQAAGGEVRFEVLPVSTGSLGSVRGCGADQGTVQPHQRIHEKRSPGEPEEVTTMPDHGHDVARKAAWQVLHETRETRRPRGGSCPASCRREMTGMVAPMAKARKLGKQRAVADRAAAVIC